MGKTMALENTLTAFLEDLSRRLPKARAILDRDADWNFADLDQESRRVAQGLSNLGVAPGDRVGFWLPNVAAYLALFFACARLRAIAVSVNTRYRAQEVGDIIGRSGCKVLLLWAEFKGIPFWDILADVDKDALAALETVVLYHEEGDEEISKLPAAVIDKKTVKYSDLRQAPPTLKDYATPESPCLIFTTSGTTSAPKFVLHPQKSLVIHAREVAHAFGYDAPNTVVLQALPFCGTFGMSQAMAALASGSALINMPAYHAEGAVQLMKTYAVTHTNGSDEMFAHFLEGTTAVNPFPQFQYGGYGAFNPNLANITQKAEERGVMLVGIYGMSEVQALYSRQPLALPWKLRGRAGGIPISKDAHVRTRDLQTGKILPYGEHGEIEVCGPSLMKEYYQNPAATEKTITADGYVRSGDLGFTESNGGFVYLARMGDVLRLGGFLVSPAEIEARLQNHPMVEKVQVVGVTTASGARAFAFVIPKAGEKFDEAVLKAYCAQGLAKFKIPFAIQPVGAFPVTNSPNGVKIQKSKLQQIAQAAVAGA